MRTNFGFLLNLMVLMLALPIFSGCIKTSGSFNQEESSVSTLDNLQFKIKKYSVFINQQLKINQQDIIGAPPFSFAIDQGVGQVDKETGLFSAPAVIGFAVVLVKDRDGKTGFYAIEVIDTLRVSSSEFSLSSGATYLLQVTGGNFPYHFEVESGDVRIDTLGLVTAGNLEGQAVIKVLDSANNFVRVLVNVVKALSVQPEQFKLVTSSTLNLATAGGVGLIEFAIQSGVGSVLSLPGRYLAGNNTGSVALYAHDEVANRAYAYGEVFGALQISPSQLRIPKNDTYNGFEVLGGLGPFSYSIVGRGSINSQTGQYIAPATSGTVPDIVAVTDSLGHSSEAQVIITESERFAVKNIILQAGESINYSTLIDGGTPTYTLSASSGSINGLNFTAPAVPGNYIVSVNDSGILNTQSMVLVYPVFKIAPTELTISVDSQYFFTVNGGVPPYGFQVLSGLGSIDSSKGFYLSGPTTGSAQIRVTDAKGLIQDAVVNIKSRLILSPDQQIIEGGGTVNLTASGGLGPYQISLASGEGILTTVDSTHASLITTTRAGIVQVEATDSIGNRVSQYIQVLPRLTIIPPTVSIKAGKEFYFATQGGLGPFQFSMVTANGSISADGLYRAGLVAGNDKIKVIDGINHTAEAQIIIYENMQLFPASKVLLVGQNLQMQISGGVSPFIYSVTSGNASGSIDNQGLFTASNSPGNAVVHVVDQEGNFADALILVNPLLQIIPTTVSLKTNKPYVFAASGGISPYKFSVLSGNGGNINPATGEYIAPNDAGNYQVQVKDAEGNIALAAVSVSNAGNGNGGTPNPSAADHLIYLAGNNQSGTVMTVLPVSLQVKVVDNNGVAVTGATLRVTVSTGSGNPGFTTLVSGSDGIVSTPYFLGRLATSEIIRFESAGTALPGAPAYFDFTEVTNAGPPALAISSLSANPVVGIPANGVATGTITATLKDIYGNSTSGISVSLTSSGTGHTISPISANTDSQGIWAATIKSTVAGSKTIGVSLPTELLGLTTMVGFGTTVTPDASLSSISGGGSPVANGISIATISINLTSASGPASGFVPTFVATDTNNTNSYGVCTLSDANGNSTCTLTSTRAESKVLTIISPVNKVGGSISFMHGIPNQINFSQTPVSAAINTAMVPQPVLEIQDVFGNRITTGTEASGVVNLNLQSGAGSLLGTTTMSAVGGLADFSGKNLAFDRAGNKTLRAVVGAYSVTSSTFSINSTPVRIAWSGNTSVVRGTCEPLTISCFDAANDLTNTASGMNINLAGAGSGFFYSDNNCATPIVSTSILADTNNKGIYFKSLVAAAHTLTADTGTFTQATYNLSVIPGAPVKLTMSGPNFSNFNTCSTVFTVAVQDSSNQATTVAIDTLINLGGQGNGHFYSGSNCSGEINNLTILAGNSSANFYFKDGLGESLILTANGTGLTAASFNFTSRYPVLVLSGTGGSTLDGVLITSCGGGSTCNATNPFNPHAVTTASNGSAVSISNYYAITMADSANITTATWDGAGGPAPGNGILDLTSSTDFNLCSTCIIQMSAHGYPKDQGPGKGLNSYSASGAAYGGNGGNSSTGTFGATAYGNYNLPNEMGSGGGNGGSTGSLAGGRGGGLVKISVAGIFNLSGKIYTDGGAGTAGFCGGSSGGGAGGGIYISTGTLSGSGALLQANGGTAIDGCSDIGGGGGGGRIAIIYGVDSYTGGVTAIGFNAFGGISPANYGGAGSIYYKNTTTNTEQLTFDQNTGGNSTSTSILQNLTVGNLTVKQNAHIQIPTSATLTVTGTMNLAGGVLTNRGTLTNTVSNLNWTLYNYGVITYPSGNLNIKSGGHLIEYNNDTFNNLTIENGGKQTIMLMPMIFNQLDLQDGGLITQGSNGSAKSKWVEITANQFILSGTIDSSSKGYISDQGPGKGIPGSNYASGAGYGGIGGSGLVVSGGDVYENYANPNELGSGGGATPSNANKGGSGGGLVKLNISGNFTLTGKILVNGGTNNFYCGNSSGAGAGGAINITAGTILGSAGVLQAIGGIATSSCGIQGGGGGGGRIAVYYVEDSYLGGLQTMTMNAYGGSGYFYGGPGTIYFKNLATLVDNLIFDQNTGGNTIVKLTGNNTVANLTIKNNAHVEIATGATLTVTDTFNNVSGILINKGTLTNPVVNLNWTLYNYGILTYPSNNLVIKSGGHLIDYVTNSFNNVTIEDGGKQTLVKMPTTYNQLDIQTGGILTHGTNTISKDFWVDVIANQVVVNGTIDASGNGYAGDQGPGKGLSNVNSASGGGYGGAGSASSLAVAGGAAFGSYLNATDLGSGGGGSGLIAGSAGGGLVKLNVVGNLTLNGKILANSLTASSNCGSSAGGGSGGGIYITTATLSGIGSGGWLQANGASTIDGCGYRGGGGGGGRIAVYYNVDNYVGGISTLPMNAFGGAGYNYGAAGSIYYKNTTSLVDTLVFDQNNYSNIVSTLLSENTAVVNLTIKNAAHLEIGTGFSLTTTGTANYSGGTMTNRGTLTNSISQLNWILNNYGTVTYPSGNLTIKAGGLLTEYAVNSFNNLTIENGGRQNLALMPTNYNQLDIQSGAVLSHLANNATKDYWVDIIANQLILSGTIDVTAKGYQSNQGLGKGSANGGGAAYGSNGGNSQSGATGGTAYGSFNLPNELGSGGGPWTTLIGGTGGGLVKLTVAGNLTLSGKIYSNAGAGAYTCGASGGGGAGGGVFLSVGTISGSGGSIDANGGAATSSCGTQGGGGSGGRISLNYGVDNYTGTVKDIALRVDGGAGFQAGALGTIYMTPKLDLNFSTGSLSPLVSFSRSSSATYFDSVGVMQTAATNVARFDYDPQSLILTGFLLEEARTNLLLWSEEFNQAAWVKTATTITANAVIAPDGITAGDKLIENSATTTHFAQQNVTLLDNTDYSFSVFVKAGERSWIALSSTDKAGTQSFSYFNITAGTLGTIAGTHLASIKTINNGWYRLNIRFNSNSGGSAPYASILLATGDLTSSYTGDGTSGAYLWGTQLEAGDCISSYVPTAATGIARSSDVASVADVTWFNTAAGVFLLEAKVAEASSNRYFLSLRDGGVPDYYQFGIDATLQSFFKITNAGIDQANLSSSTWANGNYKKLASRFEANYSSLVVNSGTVVQDGSVTLPSSMQSLRLGADQFGATRLNGHLNKIRYFPNSLTNTSLQELTK
jgi:hypothetical protein